MAFCDHSSLACGTRSATVLKQPRAFVEGDPDVGVN